MLFCSSAPPLSPRLLRGVGEEEKRRGRGEEERRRDGDLEERRRGRGEEERTEEERRRGEEEKIRRENKERTRVGSWRCGFWKFRPWARRGGRRKVSCSLNLVTLSLGFEGESFGARKQYAMTMGY